LIRVAAEDFSCPGGGAAQHLAAAAAMGAAGLARPSGGISGTPGADDARLPKSARRLKGWDLILKIVA
jgi:hypothetical protein